MDGSLYEVMDEDLIDEDRNDKKSGTKNRSSPKHDRRLALDYVEICDSTCVLNNVRTCLIQRESLMSHRPHLWRQVVHRDSSPPFSPIPCMHMQ